MVLREEWSRFIRSDRFDHFSFKMGLTLVSVAFFWSASSYGYYGLVNTLGLESGYNDAPIEFAIYYLIWAGIALLWFRKVLSGRLGDRRSLHTSRRCFLYWPSACFLWL